MQPVKYLLVLVHGALDRLLAFGADLPTFLRPDPALTPGVADPALTAEVLCAKKFTTRDVRSVTEAMKREVYERYGVQNHKGRFAKCKRGAEVDHVVSLELGGANAVENLWPEMYCGPWNAVKKGWPREPSAQTGLRRRTQLGCEAQQCISADSIVCYKEHMK